MESVKGGYPLPSAHKINPQGKIEVPLDDMSAEVPVKKDIPVTPKIDKLRNIFSSQAITTETPVAKSDLIDMDKVRSQVPRAETGISDWLTVLAPLATEAIFGGGHAGGVSYGIAGKHALDTVKTNNERSNKLEDKLMEIEKARAIASAKSQGKNALKTLEVDVNGNPIITRMEDALGQKAWKAPEKAGSDRGDIAAAGRQQQLMLANRKEIISSRKNLLQDDQFKLARNRRNTSKFALNLLKNKNPVSDAGIGLLFQKGIFADVGNATAQEQAKYVGPPDAVNTFNRIKGKALRGEVFTPNDRKALAKLADHIQLQADKDVKAIGGQHTAGLSSVGIDASGIINPMLDFTPEESMAMEDDYNAGNAAPPNRAMNPAQNNSIIPKSTPEDAEYLKWRKSKYGH